MESFTIWLKALWRRLEHLVSDFIFTLALILGLSLISSVLHKADLPPHKIKIIESIHFWVSVTLMSMFSLYMVSSLARGMLKELLGKDSES